MTRQRRWQIEKMKHGMCAKCAKPAVTKTYCLTHAVYMRERMRILLGSKNRINSLTYRLQEQS